MMAVFSSETLAHSQNTSRRYNPENEDGCLHRVVWKILTDVSEELTSQKVT
jgi:hypothetical protein